MTLPQSPLVVDEIVTRDVRERLVERMARRRRQNDVVEGVLRDDALGNVA